MPNGEEKLVFREELEMGLFGPEWKSRNAYKAIGAINLLNSDEVKRSAFPSIKSQEKLCEVVLHCDHLGLAQQNISRIVDQRLLMKLAITPYKISEKARDLITDVSVLNEVKRIKEQKQDKANLSR